MIRLLGSTKLAIALCLLLAAGGVAGSLLYQGNTAFGKPSTFNVFRSPFFLVPAVLLALNICCCVIPRLREMPAGKMRTWAFGGLHLGLLLLSAGLALDGLSGFVGTQYFPVGAPYSGYRNWRTGRDETFPFAVEVVYPALTGFFLGYVHEDFEIVYGPPEAAMDAFIEDAGMEDLLLVRRDWNALGARLEPCDEEHKLNLLGRLGSAWQPVRWADVQALFERLDTALNTEV